MPDPAEPYIVPVMGPFKASALAFCGVVAGFARSLAPSGFACRRIMTRIREEEARMNSSRSEAERTVSGRRLNRLWRMYRRIG